MRCPAEQYSSPALLEELLEAKIVSARWNNIRPRLASSSSLAEGGAV